MSGAEYYQEPMQTNCIVKILTSKKRLKVTVKWLKAMWLFVQPIVAADFQLILIKMIIERTPIFNTSPNAFNQTTIGETAPSPGKLKHSYSSGKRILHWK